MKTNKTTVILAIIAIISILFCNYSYAETTQSINSEQNLTLYSDAAILIDSATGKVLAEKNSNEKMYPASTTKILTTIIALENCKLDDKITASYDAVMSIPVGYSNAAIQPDETLSLEELLNLFLIHSANEVGMILAEHISGSVENFANLMNQKATEIGCKNTHFTNPSGIHDEEHYSTAYDMALIAQYCMKNETFRSIVSKPSCEVAATDKYEDRYFVNTNDLIRPSSQYYYEYAIGIKTGFTSQAKNCLIAASKKDNMELITVILGAQTTPDGKSARYLDSINLFEYGFNNYKFEEVMSQNEAVQEITIKNATKETKNLSLLIKDSISSTVPMNFNSENLDYSIELNENISAPIAEGSTLGKISYNIDGVTYTSDLIASHNVEKFDFILLIGQIILVIVVLIILAKLLSPKRNKKYKRKK